MTTITRRRRVETERMTWAAILETALDDDGEPMCADGACGTCDTLRGPGDGEGWQAMVERLGWNR